VPLIGLLLLLAALAGLGWLARARRLRHERIGRLREVLLQVNTGGDRFSADSADSLPVPAAQYLRHALADHAPLARSVDVRMSGTLRVGEDDWVPFEARQRICAERGFLWEARISVLRKLGVRGADWLFGDDGGAEYALAGWWPMLTREGSEIARSALGRLMVELLWLPSALTPQRGARWSRGDADRAVVTPAGNSTPMTVVVGPDGRLREASVVRRRVSANGEVSVAAFGVTVESEARWGDYCVPSRLVAAWGIGTDDRQDFMRISVDDIRWV
jgi:hypothetical protein